MDSPPGTALEDLAKQCGLNGLSDLANLKADMLSKLSPEDQKKLLEALKQCRLENLKACRECVGTLTDKEAKELLLSLTDTEKPGQECNLALLAAVEVGREPGRGGVDRGPGESGMDRIAGSFSIGDPGSASIKANRSKGRDAKLWA